MDKRCFAPVAGTDARLLILGSLPGERSLALGRYYGNPRNQFWRLAGHAAGLALETLDYDDRLAALRTAGIGLWDVIGTATRPGSLDSAIRDAKPNRLMDFAAGLPHLRAIAFNGGKAAAIGLKQLPGSRFETVTLPSSSPAHAISFERKAAAWAELARFLD